MDRESRTEQKMIAKYLMYLRKTDNPAPRWRQIGGLLCGGGVALIVFVVITGLQKPGDAVAFAIAGALGGVLAGVGMLYSTSAMQWPIVKRCMSIDQLERRELELKASGK